MTFFGHHLHVHRYHRPNRMVLPVHFPTVTKLDSEQLTESERADFAEMDQGRLFCRADAMCVVIKDHVDG